ncbi:Flp pilus assembly protein CpaB [Klenkia sp. PcliD-1-E]|uniref:Flp pilus assembly protein CpaB n=1 Tax=Klenkia sp. PcliD-1-E TaxID=2954492 RepID=UPI002096879E|nr:Flp pilus assembly protein CpaB [Klenkia sp. PcliD-1-E]MCO7219665.1 Flp pilus assembly protein CpaB [Klenkia sp. PcliD-1-E]
MPLPPLRRPRHLAHTVRRVAAGLLALLALALALRPAPSAPGAPPTERVVVAGADLAAGRSVSPGDLVVVDWPADLVPDGAARDPADLAGALLAAPLRRGEPFTDARLVGPGLWARVPPGQVAAPVRLADLAVAALLRAGDRVDVLATSEDGTTRVVAGDALVLAAPPEGPDPGLLVLAVAETTAAELATAATQATLSATLGPP